MRGNGRQYCQRIELGYAGLYPLIIHVIFASRCDRAASRPRESPSVIAIAAGARPYFPMFHSHQHTGDSTARVSTGQTKFELDKYLEATTSLLICHQARPPEEASPARLHQCPAQIGSPWYARPLQEGSSGTSLRIASWKRSHTVSSQGGGVEQGSVLLPSSPMPGLPTLRQKEQAPRKHLYL